MCGAPGPIVAICGPCGEGVSTRVCVGHWPLWPGAKEKTDPAPIVSTEISNPVAPLPPGRGKFPTSENLDLGNARALVEDGIWTPAAGTVYRLLGFLILDTYFSPGIHRARHLSRLFSCRFPPNNGLDWPLYCCGNAFPVKLQIRSKVRSRLGDSVNLVFGRAKLCALSAWRWQFMSEPFCLFGKPIFTRNF